MQSTNSWLVLTARIFLSVLVILGLTAVGLKLLTSNGADLAGRLVGVVVIFYCMIFSPAFLFYCLVLEPRRK